MQCDISEFSDAPADEQVVCNTRKFACFQNSEFDLFM